MTGKRRGEKAARFLLQAQQLREFGKELESERTFELRAAALEAHAVELLKPAGEIVRGGGEAAALEPTATDEKPVFIDTLKHPSSISLCASQERMDLLMSTNALEMGLDASESVQAENSLEKMLVHQMAATHRAAMNLLKMSTDIRLPVAIMARLTSAAARMMGMYQSGLLTLHKVRTGGKQTVVVQHVQVADGGQAVITGSVKAEDAGGKSRGGPQK